RVGIIPISSKIKAELAKHKNAIFYSVMKNLHQFVFAAGECGYRYQPLLNQLQEVEINRYCSVAAISLDSLTPITS
ncbi:MAG: hypothetical protein AB1589_38670, partial [Cyanobacteriota bacterium]